MSIFTSDLEVIHNGTKVLRTMCPFYTFLCFHQVFSGALRASGRSSIPMVTSITSFVVIRQIFLGIFTKGAADITIIGWSYSLTWGIAAVLTGLYYLFSGWLKKEEARSVQYNWIYKNMVADSPCFYYSTIGGMKFSIAVHRRGWWMTKWMRGPLFCTMNVLVWKQIGKA